MSSERGGKSSDLVAHGEDNNSIKGENQRTNLKETPILNKFRKGAKKGEAGHTAKKTLHKSRTTKDIRTVQNKTGKNKKRNR